jgi:hypothetical protein
MKQEEHQDSTSEQTNAYKVKQKIMKDIQTKILLDLNATKKVQDLCLPEINMELRMNTGYDISQTSMQKLIKLSNNKITLLGFVEKISKYLTCNQNILNELMFKAKISIINNIANNIDNDIDIISPLHMLILYIFSMDDSVCQLVNKKLQTLDISDVFTQYIIGLYQATLSLPNYVGECYRKISTIFYAPIETIIEWQSFSVATTKWGNMTIENTSTIFIIKSKTGRDISKFSRVPQNAEMVFLPNTKFVIKNYYVNNITVFGQENIRQTTFKASDINIQRAIDKIESLIVEIEEIEEIKEI